MTKIIVDTSRQYFDIINPQYISWEFYQQYLDKEPPFGELGVIVFLRTYSRFVEQLQRREYWREVVLRVVEYSISLDTVSSFESKKIEAEQLFDMIFELRGFPAGRTLWIGGTELTKADGSFNMNCSAATIDSISKIAEGFYMLMCGAGFGFSVEDKYISKLPVFYPNKTIIFEDYKYDSNKLENTLLEFHLKTKYYKVYTKESLFNESDHDYLCLILDENLKNVRITVGDSRCGWINAHRLFLTLMTLPKIESIIFNFNYVRPEGSVLKTFGGRASGFKALQDLITRNNDVINELNKPSKLNSVQVVDIINAVGLAVVVGGTRRCLPKGTLVHTDRGLIPIEDIKIGDNVKSGNTYHSVIGQWETGIKSTLKINTIIGELICSHEHRLAVLKSLEGDVEWKEAKNLTKEDRLVFNYGSTKGIHTKLPNSEFIKKNKDYTSTSFTVPELNEDVAWLFGYFHGNGIVQVFNRDVVDSSSYVSFACPDNLPECHDKIVRILRDEFKVIVNENKDTREACSKLKVTSVAFASYMNKFKQSNTSIEIPSFILQGTLEIRSAYIAGIFDSDGYCSTKESDKSIPITILSSVYPKFVKQLSAVVASLGIASKMVGGKNFNSRPDNWKLLYHLNLVGQKDINIFIDLMITQSIKLKNRVQFIKQRVKSQYGFSATPNIVKNSKCRNNFHSTYASEVNLDWMKVDEVLGNTLFAGIPITNIQEDKEYETFDIEVDNSKCFVIENGYLVHNSSQLTLGDMFDEQFIKAKEGLWTNDDLINKRPTRVMSNNSITLYENPGLEFFRKVLQSIKISGEPGLYSIGNAQKQNKNRKVTNPCFTGDMRLLTDNGYFKFEDLEDKNVNLINYRGEVTKGKVWSSGVKECVELKFESNIVIRCTPDHLFLTLKGATEARYLLGEEILVNSFDDPIVDNYSSSKVISIEHIGNHKVYDFSEPQTNWGIVEGFIAHNCGEILLDSRGCCNLTELNVVAHINKDGTFDWDTWSKSTRLVTRIGSRVTLVNMWHPEWDVIQKRDRLLGVSMTGIVEAFDILNWNNTEIEQFYSFTKKLINDVADIYHSELGINYSLLKTCIKPSGTLAQLPSVSSGIHRPYSPYYLRRIRVSKRDPIAFTLVDLGLTPVPENSQGNDLYADECNTWVFTLPMRTKAKIRSIDEPALVQLERYKSIMTHYVEHNCSITVSVDEHEWDLVAEWLYENYDCFIGISFLPKIDPNNSPYPLLPYEFTDKETYEHIKSTLPNINESELIELLTTYESTYEETKLDSDCSSGSFCPVR